MEKAAPLATSSLAAAGEEGTGGESLQTLHCSSTVQREQFPCPTHWVWFGLIPPPVRMATRLSQTPPGCPGHIPGKKPWPSMDQQQPSTPQHVTLQPPARARSLGITREQSGNKQMCLERNAWEELKADSHFLPFTLISSPWTWSPAC